MKIVCIGRNYAEHAHELKNDLPTEPLFFIKPSTALLIDDKPFYHPDFSNNIHYELELVVKISKNGKAIHPNFAHTYYEEVSLGIDMTARDIQDQLKSKGHPWEKAKAFDYSAVLGTFLHLKELGNVQSLSFQLFKNGTLAQDGKTEEMIFDVNTIICYVSKFITLQKGDLIFTGTPAGVGQIHVGDTFNGVLEGKRLISCEIK
jgi:2-keto-4-pentenoate hydratase/2-oxohepta-3-ene-1,7-dioic acid hydratase in catechol pathway